jgi:hypothetical protein
MAGWVLVIHSDLFTFSPYHSPVVDPLWQDDEVTLLTLDPDPPVIQVTHVKVACSVTRRSERQGVMMLGAQQLPALQQSSLE